MSNTLLVTGAAGQLGQRVIHHLIETYKVSPGSIIAATRSPEKLADFTARGVVARKADFDDAAALPAAFAGVDRLLIISTDALDTPGKRLSQHKAAVEAARKAGVKHILYTSMPSPGKSLVTFARLNLMARWPMRGPFHAIFCRNVMIYFDRPTQQALVARFRELLAPGGYLFVGHSESLTALSHELTYVQPAVYRR